jgi:glycosyltransferase involved in cell wall biosynthesis
MYGTPVLGADIGGIPELIRVEETGELFESGNAEQLKQKIVELWHDEQRLKNYYKNCERTGFFSAEQYIENLMKYYT